ncbi:hypothetical protein ABID82_003402 [Methylobacterium sp. PvP062]|jgi:hypothetical protein|uniref:Uncharacterized protein n=2 Tax=Methylobacterium TaxID=407 RepID=A0ABV2NCJ6_9HYPH|nr:hypothetical protein [Methylobacterium sp. PvP105]MBP2501067.1 hypothetical protein [Methylobacterium sp. PvP109]MDQ0440600.1 hypothetical protein [Methylobacterium persicinum]
MKLMSASGVIELLTSAGERFGGRSNAVPTGLDKPVKAEWTDAIRRGNSRGGAALFRT